MGWGCTLCRVTVAHLGLHERLVSALQDEWLGQQHDRHREEGNQHEEQLQLALAGEHLALWVRGFGCRERGSV